MCFIDLKTFLYYLRYLYGLKYIHKKCKILLLYTIEDGGPCHSVNWIYGLLRFVNGLYAYHFFSFLYFNILFKF